VIHQTRLPELAEALGQDGRAHRPARVAQRPEREALAPELSTEWSEAQLVELVALTGFYHMIAFFTNAFELPLEAYATPYPGGATGG
jgi:hypothetical protein